MRHLRTLQIILPSYYGCCICSTHFSAWKEGGIIFLWDYLKSISLPILIYGTGNGAEKLLVLCHKYHIHIDGIFTSDNHVHKKAFFGYSVMRRCDVLDRYAHAVILLAFGTALESVLTQIQELSHQYQVLVPDLPLMGGQEITPEYITSNRELISASKQLLGDTKSKQVFDAMLTAKLTGNLNIYLQEDTSRQEDMSILHLGSQERFLDLGAYTGDTIAEFLSLTKGKYASIDAMEPDPHNFSKLAVSTAGLFHVRLYPFASWSQSDTLTFTGKGGRNCAKKPDLPGKYMHLHKVKAVSVDSFGQDFTYIKMDVEGAEAETLLGMQETLRRCHPKLCISVYHKTDDFITLPLLLEQLCPGYRMYLRRNRCLPAWEIQLYSVYEKTQTSS